MLSRHLGGKNIKFWSHFLDRAKRVKISARQVFANRIFGIKIYWYIFEDSVFITVSICLELRLWSFWPGYWWSFRHGVRGRWTFDCEAPGPPSLETVPLCIVPIYPVPICPYHLPLWKPLDLIFFWLRECFGIKFDLFS